MKKILLYFGIALFLLNCKNEEKRIDTPFTWVDAESFIENQIPVDNEQAIEVNLEGFIKKNEKINISDIISDFSLLNLKDGDHSIGEVYKVIFDKNYVFVLDQYFSNSLYLFSRINGKQLYAFNQHGQAQNEIGTIYDFDVDFVKKIVHIFDGENRKHMKFHFNGDFVSYQKLPFRIGNVRTLPSGDFINFPKHSPNHHLGDFYSLKNIIIADSLLTPKFGAFNYDEEVIINDFYHRDYFSYNNETLSYFPRYKHEIYLLEEKDEKYEFKQLLRFNLGKRQLNNVDFLTDTEKFIENRKNDGILFPNGMHFLSSNWIIAAFDSFKGPNFDIYYNKESKQVFASQSQYNFDFNGLPFFSFPIAINGDECVSIIDSSVISALKKLSKEQKESLTEEGRWSSSIESFIDSIDDIESPVLFFYKLK